MAVTRASNSGFTSAYTKYDDMLAGYPPVMAAPTATDGGTGTTVSVAFTAVAGATGYRVISSPGSITATGSSSPVTVSGLTAGTAYTFQIQAQNSVGYGAYSAASNSVTPVNPLTVTGGTLTSDATYYYRTFTANGTLGVSGGTLTADYVVVAGGGGAGGGYKVGTTKWTRYDAGGGGAGGLILFSNVSMPTSNYTVTIGGGGSGGTGYNATGASGGQSSITGMTSTVYGGGFGAAWNVNSAIGGSGGSGGGGAHMIPYNDAGDGRAGGSGTAGQGNSGGYGPGGGGGAGGAGGSGNWTAGVGSEVWGTTYATGGGGTSGTAGAANTGSGGGATYASTGGGVSTTGGAGGSGIVIVRYTRSQVGG